MKRRFVFSLFLAGALTLAGPAGAHRATAEECTASCGMGKVGCLTAARTGKLGCKADCRQKSAPTALGACTRGCARDFRKAKDSCSADHQGCVDACMPAANNGQPTSCEASCGQSLASCAQGVVATAKTCLAGCRGGAGRGACEQNCAGAVQRGQAGCQSSFESCIGSCPSATTTTTTAASSPTTGAPPRACGAVDGGQCGGSCGSPGEVCRDVGGACGCTRRGEAVGVRR